MFRKYGGGLGLLVSLAACQPQTGASSGRATDTPPTGHFVGTLTAAGQPDQRVALDIRHARADYYDADLLASTASSLSFVTDDLIFRHDTLRLGRPGQPGEVLTLRRQGDFWRGTLLADTTRYTLLLVRRGPPEPIVYQVRKLYLSPQTVLQFAPADESLPGPAVLLLPDAAHDGAATQWGDALARQGIKAQLALPHPQQGSADTMSAGFVRQYLAYVGGRGVDSTQVGLWLAGKVAAGLPAMLADTAERLPPLAFAVLLHPPLVPPRRRAAWQQLSRRLPVLALYNSSEVAAATSMRAVLGRSASSRVSSRYPPTAGGDQQMQADVAAWLRELATRRKQAASL